MNTSLKHEKRFEAFTDRAHRLPNKKHDSVSESSNLHHVNTVRDDSMQYLSIHGHDPDVSEIDPATIIQVMTGMKSLIYARTIMNGSGADPPRHWHTVEQKKGTYRRYRRF